jgi:hypothetical protein
MSSQDDTFWLLYDRGLVGHKNLTFLASLLRYDFLNLQGYDNVVKTTKFPSHLTPICFI